MWMGAGWGQGVGAGFSFRVFPLVAADHMLQACTTQGGSPAPLSLPVPQGRSLEKSLAWAGTVAASGGCPLSVEPLLSP